MIDIVMDASAVGAAILMDEGGKLGRAAFDAWDQATIRAPVHWPIEVVSIIVKAERDGRLVDDQITKASKLAFALISTTQIQASITAETIFDLARHHKLSAQDAAYLDLALNAGAALLTGDKALARAAKSLSIPLIYDI